MNSIEDHDVVTFKESIDLNSGIMVPNFYNNLQRIPDILPFLITIRVT